MDALVDFSRNDICPGVVVELFLRGLSVVPLETDQECCSYSRTVDVSCVPGTFISTSGVESG